MSSGDGRGGLRDSVSKDLGTKLPRLLGRAFAHEQDALATMARLRRGVGAPFGRNPEASGELVRLLALPAGTPADREGNATGLGRLVDDAYLVATLVAFTRVRVREASEPSTFGRDLRSLARRRPDTAERLFRPILRASRAELDHHLRRAFALLASEDRLVDAAALVRELGAWDDDREWVQKRWAYDFWVGPEDESESDSQIDTKGAVQG